MPRRVTATRRQAADGERAGILAPAGEVKHRLDAELQSDGHNVGAFIAVIIITAVRGLPRKAEREAAEGGELPS